MAHTLSVNTTAAMVNGTAMLTLSQETRDIQGGFIMVDGDVEINCAFETLVRLQREKLERKVADALFA
jgi:V/A-type H+-transporting ATPase subunit E